MFGGSLKNSYFCVKYGLFQPIGMDESPLHTKHLTVLILKNKKH